MDIVLTECPECKEKVSLLRQSITALNWVGYCKCNLMIEYNGYSFMYSRKTSSGTTNFLFTNIEKES